MKRSADETIDRVLNGLRTAEPHAGLEQRVSLGLERRRTEAFQPERRAAFSRPGGVSAAAAAAALALTVSLIAWYLPSRPRHPAAHGGAKPAAADSLGQIRATVAEPLQTAHRSPPRPASQAQAPLVRIAVAHLETATPGDEGAASLPSQPAPEAPLTQQETLLLRVARHSDTEQVAVLNPEMREEIARVEARDFQNFFKSSELEEKINAMQAAQLPPQK